MEGQLNLNQGYMLDINYNPNSTTSAEAIQAPSNQQIQDFETTQGSEIDLKSLRNNKPKIKLMHFFYKQKKKVLKQDKNTQVVPNPK